MLLFLVVPFHPCLTWRPPPQVADPIRDRVIPPDTFNSDGSEAKELPGASGPLPPWDKLRYVWRGELKVGTWL